MNWKLPLNQVGSGCTFVVGPFQDKTKFRSSRLNLAQHAWLQDIITELNCSADDENGNFSLAVDVEKQGETYRVGAHLRMVPQLECVRSLTPFRTAIDSENEALYMRGLGTPSGGEHELSESEMESYEHDGQGLLLSEFVTDVVFTSLPDFPLCCSDCRGLCADCGCNLNDAKSCGNKDDSADSDFSCPHAQYFQ